MANTLSVFQPKIIAAALQVLREEAILVKTVNRGYSDDAKQQGDAVTIPVPAASSAAAVTPAATPPAVVDLAPSSATITLNQWQGSRFNLTTRDMATIANGDFRKSQMAEAIRNVVNAINVTLWALYKKVPNFTGTAGTTPYASNTQGTTQVRKVLNRFLAPKEGRTLVLDYEAEAKALELDPFRLAWNRGNGDTINSGVLGSPYGILHVSDSGVPQHVAGTASAGTVSLGAVSAVIGDTTLTLKMSSGTGTVVIGDVFKVNIGGIDYMFTATSAGTLDTTGVAISVFPTVPVAIPSTTAVTYLASHRVNLGYHYTTFGMASRPLVKLAASEISEVMVDPETGLALKFMLMPGYHLEQYEVSCLWGVSEVRPQLGCRLAG